MKIERRFALLGVLTLASYGMLWPTNDVEREAPIVAPAALTQTEPLRPVPSPVPRAIAAELSTAQQPSYIGPSSTGPSSGYGRAADLGAGELGHDEAQRVQAREELDRGVERMFDQSSGLAARFERTAATADVGVDETLLDALAGATGGGEGVLLIECRSDLCRVTVDRTTIDVEQLTEGLRQSLGGIVQSWPVPLFADELDAMDERPEEVYLLMHADASSAAEGLLRPARAGL